MVKMRVIGNNKKFFKHEKAPLKKGAFSINVLENYLFYIKKLIFYDI